MWETFVWFREEMVGWSPMIRVGDLVRFSWTSEFPPSVGIVLEVWDPPNYHAKIDYTFVLLERGKKHRYDVFRDEPRPEVISETR